MLGFLGFFDGLCWEGTLMGTRIPLRTKNDREKELAAKLELSTAEIGLSVRTTNCLEEKGIFTVNDLLHSTREELLSIANFGEKTLEEVYKALEKIGFYRQDRQPSEKVESTTAATSS